MANVNPLHQLYGMFVKLRFPGVSWRVQIVCLFSNTVVDINVLDIDGTIVLLFGEVETLSW